MKGTQESETNHKESVLARIVLLLDGAEGIHEEIAIDGSLVRGIAKGEKILDVKRMILRGRHGEEEARGVENEGERKCASYAITFALDHMASLPLCSVASVPVFSACALI